MNCINNYIKLICFLKTGIVCIFVMSISSCRKLITVDPPITTITGASLYGENSTAIASLTGIYTNLAGSNAFEGSFATGARSVSLLAGLSSDEFTLYSALNNQRFIAYYKNSLNANSKPSSGSEYWSELYNIIFHCNAALEGLDNSTTLTSNVKQQLTGEAKFLRGFCYFYLVNLFGDVPLATTTDYTVNAKLPRASSDDIYKFIIQDLEQAESLLSTEYLDASLEPYTGSAERVRPTKWAASALLARVYLYDKNFAGAQESSAAVINHAGIYVLTNLNEVFLMNSREAIWQLQPVNAGRNTEDGFTFIIREFGLNDQNPVFLSSELLNSFEAGDERKFSWIDTAIVGTDSFYFPFKYKVAISDAPAEYLMVLRLSEQYLIRAEARLKQGNITGALEDLNVLRNRAGLDDFPSTDEDGIMTAILHERQVELFSEWGHRWFDLKRTGKIDVVMNQVCPQKGGTWSTNWQWYPLPIEDLQKDVNLTQNPGY